MKYKKLGKRRRQVNTRLGRAYKAFCNRDFDKADDWSDSAHKREEKIFSTLGRRKY